MEGDLTVVATNDDATNAKKHAVSMGYWSDPFINDFPCARDRSGRRPPVINHGYFARVATVYNSVCRFLEHGAERGPQILNLGCGYDTLYWRLAAQGLTPPCMVEVDFDEVVLKKRHSIESKPRLRDVTAADASNYHLLAGDLRAPQQLIQNLASKTSLDFRRPTMVITECVLAYMKLSESRALIAAMVEKFDNIFWMNYDPIHPNDAFGRMMLANLSRRGCRLPGMEECSTLGAHMQRYLDAGMQVARAHDMRDIYFSLPPDERTRIERIEFLDEVEEWNLFNTHYCFAWGWKETTTQFMSAVGPQHQDS